jgi:hypothetical protein
MKDSNICKRNYLPRESKKDGEEILNATYNYVRRFGMILENFNLDEFFQYLVVQVSELVTNHNPDDIIRISETFITKLGYYDEKSFEVGFLYKVYLEVARTQEINFETVVEKMNGRVVFFRED